MRFSNILSVALLGFATVVTAADDPAIRARQAHIKRLNPHSKSTVEARSAEAFFTLNGVRSQLNPFTASIQTWCYSGSRISTQQKYVIGKNICDYLRRCKQVIINCKPPPSPPKPSRWIGNKPWYWGPATVTEVSTSYTQIVQVINSCLSVVRSNANYFGAYTNELQTLTNELDSTVANLGNYVNFNSPGALRHVKRALAEDKSINMPEVQRFLEKF